MTTIHYFEDLEIWKLARKICWRIYDHTRKDPLKRDFSMVDQLRRSSGSIMDNIAEGFERTGAKEFVYFLSISKASCGECRAQVYRALDQNYLTEEEFVELHKLLTLESQKIYSLITYLKNSSNPGEVYKKKK